MDRLMRLAEGVSRAGALFGGALLILAAFVVSIDVVLRKWFLVTLGGADELAGYALAISSAWALAYGLVGRVHIRIDSLYVLLPKTVRVALDVAGLVAFLAFFALILWHGWGVLEQSIEADTRSVSPLGTPLAIPQTFWVLGLIQFVLVALVLLARSLHLLMARDVAGTQRLIGSRSAVEEVEDELKGLEELRPDAETAR